jgi:acyl carrier protein phosphodiesterase
MNYLAHAHLSFQNAHWLVGNLISDFIKGNRKLLLHPSIQQGITLHRAIDAFTDQHDATAEAKTFFRPAYRLYSGAFVDVVYDHFLATDPAHFPTEAALFGFSQTVYQQVFGLLHEVPETLHPFFSHMRGQNWLYNYRLHSGVSKSFGGLVHRSLHLTDAEPAMQVFRQHYPELQKCYQRFYPDLQAFAQNFVVAQI